MRSFSASLAPITAAILLAACAHNAEAAPPAQTAAAARKAAAAEAAELEAARQHPIAHPEPRSVYPEQAPPPRPERGLPDKAPPPREERGLPEQAPLPRETGPSSGLDSGSGSGNAPAGEIVATDTRVVAPEQPPIQPFAESRPPPPAVHYVWAPGYWYWYGGRYVWISGSWVAPRAGHVYVSARWVYGNDGWVFSPGGWAIGIGGPVVYPLYPHDAYGHRYGHPYRDHHHRDWGGGYRHADSPRRASPSDRSVVRPDRRYSAPPRTGGRSTTVVRPRSSGNATTGDVPRSSGEPTRVKARRR